jgi:hypothetical protein
MVLFDTRKDNPNGKTFTGTADPALGQVSLLATAKE